MGGALPSRSWGGHTALRGTCARRASRVFPISAFLFTPAVSSALLHPPGEWGPQGHGRGSLSALRVAAHLFLLAGGPQGWLRLGPVPSQAVGLARGFLGPRSHARTHALTHTCTPAGFTHALVHALVHTRTPPACRPAGHRGGDPASGVSLQHSRGTRAGCSPRGVGWDWAPRAAHGTVTCTSEAAGGHFQAAAQVSQALRSTLFLPSVRSPGCMRHGRLAARHSRVPPGHTTMLTLLPRGGLGTRLGPDLWRWEHTPVHVAAGAPAGHCRSVCSLSHGPLAP